MRTRALKVSARGLRACKLGAPGATLGSTSRARGGETSRPVGPHRGTNPAKNTSSLPNESPYPCGVSKTNLRTRAEFQKRISVPVRSFVSGQDAKGLRAPGAPASKKARRNCLLPSRSLLVRLPLETTCSLALRLFSRVRPPAGAPDAPRKARRQQLSPLRRLHSSSRRCLASTAAPAAASSPQLAPLRLRGSSTPLRFWGGPHHPGPPPPVLHPPRRHQAHASAVYQPP